MRFLEEAMIDKPLVPYDIETLFNCFLFGAKFLNDPTVHVFEISWRKNQRRELLAFLDHLKQIDAHMLGYNNIGFDYPIIHELMMNPHGFDMYKSYQLAQKIIENQNYGFSPYTVKLQDRLIHQVDLVKIWHFDNENKRTRLKDLQFNMRSDTVEDLPHDFRKPVTSEQIDDFIHYMKHDITETEKFAHFSAERIKLRRDLVKSRTVPGDVMNWNDTKLGEQFFINKLGREKCYNGSKPKGTDRLRVDFKDIILGKIKFRLEHFDEVLREFKSKVWIKGDKDHNKTISFERELAGVKFKFGSGGVHASVEKQVFRTNDTHKIIDIDVSSYYPSGAIVNRIYPEHLGELFVAVYEQLKRDRKQYAKGTLLNAVFKLALNGVFGKLNSEYSPVFDMKALLSITINCQLQLLQLVEMLTHIPGLQIIQANTDGITAYVPRQYEWMFDMWKKEWERITGYELEQVEYKAMFIRDVNNYLAQKTDGSVKRKGAYWFADSWKDYDEGAGHWHTDNSMTVVPKVAEAVMLYGIDPAWYIRTMSDPFDFMIRLKVIGGQKGYIGETETQKTLRYYVSKAGQPCRVIRPAAGIVGQYKRKNKLTDKFFESVMAEIGPGVWDARIHTANQSKYEDTVSNVQSGWLVKDCCDAKRFDWRDVDYEFYLEEINKLIIRG